MQKLQAIFCWSGGKDSSLALYDVLQEGIYEVKYLLTTVNETFRRISMHGIREELLKVQAKATGIPLKIVYVAEGSNAEYERNMASMLLECKAEGINHVIFGDIFLEDLRLYRENNLNKVCMKAVFPLWKKDTKELMTRFLDLKFRTITCCINDAWTGADRAGVEIDEVFLRSLPEAVDPCGENGEFHTFCFEGPVFHEPIRFHAGEKVYKPLEIKTDSGSGEKTSTRGFWFCDLIPD